VLQNGVRKFLPWSGSTRRPHERNSAPGLAVEADVLRGVVRSSPSGCGRHAMIRVSSTRGSPSSDCSASAKVNWNPLPTPRAFRQRIPRRGVNHPLANSPKTSLLSFRAMKIVGPYRCGSRNDGFVVTRDDIRVAQGQVSAPFDPRRAVVFVVDASGVHERTCAITNRHGGATSRESKLDDPGQRSLAATDRLWQQDCDLGW